MGCRGPFCTQVRGEVRPSAAPPSPGQTSTAPCSSGPPFGRSGMPGSVLPGLPPALPSRWATPPQCRGQSSQRQGPPSPAALVVVPAQSGCPGSAAASPGPISGNRNAGPGVSWSCRQSCRCSFAPDGLTCWRRLTALNSTSHASSSYFDCPVELQLETAGSGSPQLWSQPGDFITLAVPDSVASGD